MPSFLEIITGKTETTVFSELKAKLTGRGLPVLFWGGGDPIPVILQHGLSPLLSTAYAFIADTAKGGLLRYAQAQAEADLATWEADPANTFLGWLAEEWFAVTPTPPAFTIGTEQMINGNAGASVLPAGARYQGPSGLYFRLVGPAVSLPPGVSYVQIQAEQPGSAYNVDAGTITKLATTIAGVTASNQPQPPATSWISTYGGGRETPASVALRCRANWGRLTLLQTSPADAYVALALDQAITGTAAVRKVAVWPSYRDGVGFAANYVTLYLAGDAGPVPAAAAALVQAALRPYIGIHDQLAAVPCGTVAYSPAIIAYVAQQADVQPAALGIYQQLLLLQQQLKIGGTVYASDIRRAVLKVPQVLVESDTLSDFVPAKNALVTLMTGLIGVQVGPP